MLRRDGSGDVGRRLRDELGRVLGRDMLHDDLERRELGDERLQHLLDELCLAVEDVDARVGHLTVHKQRHAELAHGLERRVRLLDLRDTRVRVGRRTCGVELDGEDVARRVRLADLVAGRPVRQVQRHERLESRAALGWHGREDPVTVLERVRRRRDRRHEVGHHDAARELLGSVRRRQRERRGAIAKVVVQVVGASGPAELGRRGGSRGSHGARKGAGDRSHPKMVAGDVWLMSPFRNNMASFLWSEQNEDALIRITTSQNVLSMPASIHTTNHI